MTSLLHDYRRRAWAVPFRRLTSQFGVVIGSRSAALLVLSLVGITERGLQGGAGICPLVGGVLEQHRQQTRIRQVDAGEIVPGPLARAVGEQIRTHRRWVARRAQARGGSQRWKGAR